MEPHCSSWTVAPIPRYPGRVFEAVFRSAARNEGSAEGSLPQEAETPVSVIPGVGATSRAGYSAGTGQGNRGGGGRIRFRTQREVIQRRDRSSEARGTGRFLRRAGTATRAQHSPWVSHSGASGPQREAKRVFVVRRWDRWQMELRATGALRPALSCLFPDSLDNEQDRAELWVSLLSYEPRRMRFKVLC